MTAKLLKKDIFGQVLRIDDGAGPRIVRDSTRAAPWARWLARRLLANEARALAVIEGIDGLPALLKHGRDRLERSFLEGRPMQDAKPRKRAYFRSALHLLRRLHAAGVAHNDLAKEPNLLVAPDGRAAFIDLQLASYRPRRDKLFRIMAHEDLRHLLKHKRSYCPDALTARERRILARPSWPSRLWRRSGKPVYLFVTRRLLGWADREGAGDRVRR